MDRKRPPYVEAGLGIDIGNFHSKQTLYFCKNGVSELRRVEYVGETTYRPRPPDSLHEISGRAGLDKNDQVVMGPAALEADLTFTVTIKTLLLFSALGYHKVVEKAPDGPILLDAIKNGRIDAARIDDMILQHLCLLLKLADKTATKYRLTVTRCGLSYPDFMGEDGYEKEVNKYIARARAIVRKAWEKLHPGRRLPRFYSASEGQASAQYICASFVGNVLGSPQDSIRDLCEGLDMQLQTPLVVYDGGSSSLSVHVLLMSFDGQLNLVNSSSIDIQGLSTGVQDGSDLANSELRRRITSGELSESSWRTTSIHPAELRVYMHDFEAHKRKINFAHDPDNKLGIRLGGRETSQIAPLYISGQRVREVMHVGYDAVLDLIRRTNQRICEFDTDFAILYCGGSLANPGSRSVLAKDLKELQRLAKTRWKRVQAKLLVDTDVGWSTAVSAGTALCIMHMPLPGQLLRKSAIGIQRIGRDSSAERWEGENEADILFCDGAGVWRSDQETCEPFKKVTFSLVVDPEYNTKRSPNDFKCPPLKISGPEEVFTSPHATYDLGLYLDADDLPKGNIRFEIDDKLLENIAKGDMTATGEDLEDIPFAFSCRGLDAGKNLSHGPLDKQWHGTIKTDPGTKRLMISDVQELPFWCGRTLSGHSKCKRRLDETTHVCDTCPGFFVHYFCLIQVRAGKTDHPRDHSFSPVREACIAPAMMPAKPAHKSPVSNPAQRTVSREVSLKSSKSMSQRREIAEERAREAYNADFPTGSTRIPTPATGLQCAWAALVLSWNAQRGRLEAVNGSQYRDIRQEELSKNFDELRGEDPAFADHMSNTHTFRVDQMALNITRFLAKTFGINVQMGYLYPSAGEERTVLVPLADGLVSVLRLWVYSNNFHDNEWSNAHFEGLQDRDPDMAKRGRGRTCHSCRRQRSLCVVEEGHASCSQCRRSDLACEFSDSHQNDSGSPGSTTTVIEDGANSLDGGDDELDGGSGQMYKKDFKQTKSESEKAVKGLSRAQKAWSVANIETIIPKDILPWRWTLRTVASLNKLACLTGVQHRDWAIAELKRQVEKRPIHPCDRHLNRRTIRAALVQATIEAAKKEGKVIPDVAKGKNLSTIGASLQVSAVQETIEVAAKDVKLSPDVKLED